jgi:hypothetical protein
MTSRAQGSAAIVAARMAKSAEEMSHWSQYAYVVVNRGLAHSVAEIAALSPPSACAAPAKWGSPNSSTTSAAADSRTSSARLAAGDQAPLGVERRRSFR